MKKDERVKKADIMKRLKDPDSPDQVSIKEFCWLLRQNGLSHNHGYFHYTTWDRLRDMLEKHDVSTGEQHRLFFLSAASQMNDVVCKFRQYEKAFAILINKYFFAQQL